MLAGRRRADRGPPRTELTGRSLHSADRLRPCSYSACPVSCTAPGARAGGPKVSPGVKQLAARPELAPGGCGPQLLCGARVRFAPRGACRAGTSHTSPGGSPVRPSVRSCALKRVVMRTSVGCAPPVKGCTDTSRRPCSVSKPATAASFLNLKCEKQDQRAVLSVRQEKQQQQQLLLQALPGQLAGDRPPDQHINKPQAYEITRSPTVTHPCRARSPGTAPPAASRRSHRSATCRLRGVGWDCEGHRSSLHTVSCETHQAAAAVCVAGHACLPAVGRRNTSTCRERTPVRG